MTPAAKERRRWEFHGLNGNSKKSSRRGYRDQQDMPPLKKKIQPEEQHCYYSEKDPEILGLCLTNALRKVTQSVNRSYLLNKLNKREGPSTQKSTGTKVAQVHCRSRKPL